MNLHEYQAKKLFSLYGLPIPIGFVCDNIRDAEYYALKICNGPWIFKCQVHAGGRGKSGGVKLINSPEEIRTFAENWFGKRLVTYQTNSIGQPVHKILIEAVTNIVKELYLGALVDSRTSRVLFIASTEGGIDIDNVAEKTPSCIHQVALDPITGPQPYQGRELAFNLGLDWKQVNQFSHIFMVLASMILENDLEMVEINPLVISDTGDLICLDGKVTVDSNAQFRQSKLYQWYDYSQYDAREIQAIKCKLNYVALDGNIGCMVNGAGLAMGTMDVIKLHGGKPANFLDVGGSTTKSRVIEAFKIIVSDANVQAILVNIFGGVVRCDMIAEGIINAMLELVINIPVVVCLEGTNAEVGLNAIANSKLNIIISSNLAEAAKKVIAMVANK